VLINLLGPPSVQQEASPPVTPRGRKVWGLLAYMALSERAPSRQQLVDLLFTEADDPASALRWNLSELRRLLGDRDAVRGRDRVELRLPDGVVVDALTLLSGSSTTAVDLGGIGRELLEGLDFGSSPAFDAWLLGMRRHLLASACAVLRDAALRHLAVGEPRRAVEVAVRLVAADPLDEEAHALLIRSHAATGDRVAVARQLDASVALFGREFGVEAPPAFLAAAKDPPPVERGRAGAGGSSRALLESGKAAVGAGAVDVGVTALQHASASAHASGDRALEARAALALGSALVHAAKGRDGDGADALYRAIAVSEGTGERAVAASAYRELGYVELIRGEYPRARALLLAAEELADGDNLELAQIRAVRGACLSDVGAYAAGEAELRAAADLARDANHGRQLAWALNGLGRVFLLCDRLPEAGATLERVLSLVTAERWTAFRPFPEALLGETHLREGNLALASEGFEHAFALGCQVDDACWEAYGVRGLGLLRAAEGDLAAAASLLEEAGTRCDRQSDTHRWVKAYALDARCAVGVALRLPEVSRWIDELESLASRAGMREMVVRAYLHRRDLGNASAALSAAALAVDLENPALGAWLSGVDPMLSHLLGRASTIAP
jgi:DNA-binding SARP family transcriptional activator